MKTKRSKQFGILYILYSAFELKIDMTRRWISFNLMNINEFRSKKIIYNKMSFYILFVNMCGVKTEFS